MSILDSVPIAGTFSKDSTFWGGKNFPVKYITEGSGYSVCGSNGRWYIDWVGGLGACLLGWGQDAEKTAFTSHIIMHVEKGNGFSLPYYLEYTVAGKLNRMLNKHVPGWNNADLQTRWVKTGSDACNVAIRLARAITGKFDTASSGYHGFQDQFVALTPPAHGIPKEVGTHMHPFVLGDMSSLDQWDGKNQLAAIIFEHGIDELPANYYGELRKFCNRNSCLLIVDEVVTGLRYSMGGACEKYNIQPDIICMGKSLGNGYPIAAVVAPKQYMDWFARNDPVFVSSTNAGDTVSLAACDYILDHWTQKRIDELYKVGEQLINGLRTVGCDVIGHAPRSVLQFKNEIRRAGFIRGMEEHGVLINRPNVPSTAHNKIAVDHTVKAALDVNNKLAEMNDEAILAALGGEDGLPRRLFTNR